MLNHLNTVILFFIVLFALIITDQSEGIAWFWYPAVVIPFFLIEIYGASFISSNFHIKAVCRARTKEKEVAFTFDDGPGESTPRILEVLKKHDVKAAFFLHRQRDCRQRRNFMRCLSEVLYK